MRRRAILIVEYTVRQDSRTMARTPDASWWERIWGGSRVKDLHVEVQEDKAWP